ncbi:MAG: hypothetical protein QHC90_04040 [Shinella sp.]|nr:hypothetical protein [Shinella sp.]
MAKTSRITIIEMILTSSTSKASLRPCPNRQAAALFHRNRLF